MAAAYASDDPKALESAIKSIAELEKDYLTQMNLKQQLNPDQAAELEGKKETAKKLAMTDSDLSHEVRTNAEGARNTLQVIDQLESYLSGVGPDGKPSAVTPNKLEGAVGPVQGSGWFNSTVAPVVSTIFGDSAAAAPSTRAQLAQMLSGLELQGAQMYLKGQGAVTESERSIVRDMMGGGTTVPDIATLKTGLAKLKEIAASKIQRQLVLQNGGIGAVKQHDQGMNETYLDNLKGGNKTTGGADTQGKSTAGIKPLDEVGAKNALTLIEQAKQHGPEGIAGLRAALTKTYGAPAADMLMRSVVTPPGPSAPANNTDFSTPGPDGYMQ